MDRAFPSPPAGSDTRPAACPVQSSAGREAALEPIERAAETGRLRDVCSRRAEPARRTRGTRPPGRNLCHVSPSHHVRRFRRPDRDQRCGRRARLRRRRLPGSPYRRCPERLRRLSRSRRGRLPWRLRPLWLRLRVLRLPPRIWGRGRRSGCCGCLGWLQPPAGVILRRRHARPAGENVGAYACRALCLCRSNDAILWSGHARRGYGVGDSARGGSSSEHNALGPLNRPDGARPFHFADLSSVRWGGCEELRKPNAFRFHRRWSRRHHWLGNSYNHLPQLAFSS
jgi:hypothetical protein